MAVQSGPRRNRLPIIAFSSQSTGRWASALRPQFLLLSGELGLDCRSRHTVPQHPVSVWTLCPLGQSEKAI